jgi:signal transduction histidine kinase
VLLWSTAAPELRTLAGDLVFSPSLAEGVANDDDRVWLAPVEAAALDLPEAPAVAGLARIQTRRLGDWVVAVVSSLEHQRKRESRRYVRTAVMVSLASLVIISLGAVLLRYRGHAQALVGALTHEDARRDRETRLTRESRMAALLTFATGIAHELSTPLAMIAVRAEELARNAVDDRTRRGAQAILEQIRRIQERTRQFVMLARGATPPRERRLTAEIIGDAVARARHRFDHAGVSLEILPFDPSLSLCGDTRLLEYSLTSLLINACDASSPGGAVELSTNVVDERLTIAVRDRGPGIDPALFARLMARRSVEHKHEGTGLGLAITGEIMRMHNGELVLAARAGGGTSAALCLPIERARVLASQTRPNVRTDRE